MSENNQDNIGRQDNVIEFPVPQKQENKETLRVSTSSETILSLCEDDHSLSPEKVAIHILTAVFGLTLEQSVEITYGITSLTEFSVYMAHMNKFIEHKRYVDSHPFNNIARMIQGINPSIAEVIVKSKDRLKGILEKYNGISIIPISSRYGEYMEQRVFCDRLLMNLLKAINRLKAPTSNLDGKTPTKEGKVIAVDFKNKN